jgi:hypothetical protein
MKIVAIIILVFFYLELQANPFASKSKPPPVLKPKQEKKEVPLESVPHTHYLGKVEIDKEYFGIIVFQNRQYLLKDNEKFYDFSVIELKNEYILLEKEGELYRIDIYK